MGLEQRVQRLEKQNRNLRLGLIGMVLVVFTGMAAGVATIGPPEVVTAQRFDVVNAEGKVLASFGVTDPARTASLSVKNTMGSTVLLAGVDPMERGFMSVGNLAGTAMVTLTSTSGELEGVEPRPDGQQPYTFSGLVEVRNQDGVALATLGENDGGAGIIETAHRSGEVAVRITTTKGRSGSIATFDARGRELVAITSNEDGDGGVLAKDPDAVKPAGILSPR